MQHDILQKLLALDHTASSKNPFIYVISQPVLQRVDGPNLAPYGFIVKTEAIARNLHFSINHFRDGRQRRPTQAARSGEPVQPEAVQLQRKKGSRRAGASDEYEVESNIDRIDMAAVDGPCAETSPTRW